MPAGNRDEPRVLGQKKPAATTRVDCVTIQANKWATVTSFTACNQGAAISTIQVSVAPRGVAHAVGQFIMYNKPIAVGDTIWVTGESLQLQSGDVIRVYSDTGDVSFTFAGTLRSATTAKNG